MTTLCMMYERWCVTKMCVKDGVCNQDAMPATQKCRGVNRDQGPQARHQTQPSLISATPATQNEGGCRQVPRLPRKVQVDVTKCHVYHAKCKWMSPSATQKCRGVNRDQGAPSASPDPAQSHKCHACHAKRRWMSPSATPAT